MTISQLEEDVLLEVAYVRNVPWALWDLLGRRARWDAAGLRHAAISCALTSASFVTWRLQYLHELPWTLTRGDIPKNLEDLASKARPEDETAAKVWDLLRVGYPNDDIVRAYVAAPGVLLF